MTHNLVDRKLLLCEKIWIQPFSHYHFGDRFDVDPGIYMKIRKPPSMQIRVQLETDDR